jgi:hypothetical protein
MRTWPRPRNSNDHPFGTSSAFFGFLALPHAPTGLVRPGHHHLGSGDLTRETAVQHMRLRISQGARDVALVRAGRAGVQELPLLGLMAQLPPDGSSVAPASLAGGAGSQWGSLAALGLSPRAAGPATAAASSDDGRHIGASSSGAFSARSSRPTMLGSSSSSPRSSALTASDLLHSGALLPAALPPVPQLSPLPQSRAAWRQYHYNMEPFEGAVPSEAAPESVTQAEAAAESARAAPRSRSLPAGRRPKPPTDGAPTVASRFTLVVHRRKRRGSMGSVFSVDEEMLDPSPSPVPSSSSGGGSPQRGQRQPSPSPSRSRSRAGDRPKSRERPVSRERPRSRTATMATSASVPGTPRGSSVLHPVARPVVPALAPPRSSAQHLASVAGGGGAGGSGGGGASGRNSVVGGGGGQAGDAVVIPDYIGMQAEREREEFALAAFGPLRDGGLGLDLASLPAVPKAVLARIRGGGRLQGGRVGRRGHSPSASVRSDTDDERGAGGSTGGGGSARGMQAYRFPAAAAGATTGDSAGPGASGNATGEDDEADSLRPAAEFLRQYLRTPDVDPYLPFTTRAVAEPPVRWPSLSTVRADMEAAVMQKLAQGKNSELRPTRYIVLHYQ